MRNNFKSSILSIGIFIILNSSCRSALPSYLNENRIRINFNIQNQPVVFVPGIKGSILKDNDGNTHWLNASTALGFATPDLHLFGESRDLQAVGALNRLTAIPYLIDVAIYGPWLESMSSQEDIDFYVFSYDWRKKNLDTREQLILFLEEVAQKYKKKPILIGHSMGGMLSFSSVNVKPNLVAKVVYVGVPFRGGIGYMKDLHVGNPTGFNAKIQGPCMIAKYETVYGFFPRLNTWDSKDVVLDSNGKTIDLDLYEANTWKENQLGFYANDCKTEEIPSEMELQTILDNSRIFRESLTPSKSLLQAKIPTMVVHGKNLPVRKAMTLISSESGIDSKSKLWDLEIAPKDLGDGSVSFANSQPPLGIIYKSILTENEHSVMLNDPSIQEQILEFIK